MSYPVRFLTNDKSAMSFFFNCIFYLSTVIKRESVTNGRKRELKEKGERKNFISKERGDFWINNAKFFPEEWEGVCVLKIFKNGHTM